MNRVGRSSGRISAHRAERPLARRAFLTLLPVLLWAMMWHGVVVGTAAPAPLPPASFTPAVLEAMQGIESTTLTAYVGDLSGEWPIQIGGETVRLVTRYSFAEPYIDLAESYALERFADLGLPATCHSYVLETTTRCNIVAEQRGVLAPDRIVIMGAHLDSITTSRPERFYDAPGADDNASGSAAVLAAAEVLRTYELPFTVRYVLFTGEEQGLYGSKAYAEMSAAAGDTIVAMVNLDMIGYNTSTRKIDVHVRAGAQGAVDRSIADVFSRTLTTYNVGLTPAIIAGGSALSDHKSFWSQGYPAVLIIEDGGNFNPNYHKTSDRLSALNIDYMTRASQAAVATVMQLAGVVDFVHKPALVSVGQPITLWAISHLPGTLPVTYGWNLGNGILMDGPLITPTFSLGRFPAVTASWHVTMTVSYEGETLHISKQLPVHRWSLHLPMVLRMM
jgi:Zn-dependent M28 family amino/carboxypeptidase